MTGLEESLPEMASHRGTFHIPEALTATRVQSILRSFPSRAMESVVIFSNALSDVRSPDHTDGFSKKAKTFYGYYRA